MDGHVIFKPNEDGYRTPFDASLGLQVLDIIVKGVNPGTFRRVSSGRIEAMGFVQAVSRIYFLATAQRCSLALL